MVECRTFVFSPNQPFVPRSSSSRGAVVRTVLQDTTLPCFVPSIKSEYPLLMVTFDKTASTTAAAREVWSRENACFGACSVSTNDTVQPDMVSSNAPPSTAIKPRREATGAAEARQGRVRTHEESVADAVLASGEMNGPADLPLSLEYDPRRRGRGHAVDGRLYGGRVVCYPVTAGAEVRDLHVIGHTHPPALRHSLRRNHGAAVAVNDAVRRPAEEAAAVVADTMVPEEANNLLRLTDSLCQVLHGADGLERARHVRLLGATRTLSRQAQANKDDKNAP